ncbi:hypothetical protein CEUSTIGMA_g10638.t1 [Chlamydomonas eustigma]|uniref:RING-type domain-containing protein n=1 Tax=Chlamydomonas eustigma TaxID=1157962 RepID=A0A250XJW8_9CHLO|nr:hypothetical protein CEUSTIGMA_g10638.t1 [Chlamydomonas eustigma]|eukprot:GAX83212.1 hypothetical protein CEUSTIGMA_g10638.t1 [Chlamydomonas eustigma]
MSVGASCTALLCRPHPFHVAVEAGNAEVVKATLLANAKLLNSRGLHPGMSPWHIAARKGHTAILKIMVDIVLNVPNAPSLMTSTIGRLFSMPNTPEKLLKAFLHLRCGRGALSPLMLAAQGGHLETVEYLLSIGADCWQGDKSGTNALHYAARFGRVSVIHALLANPPPPVDLMRGIHMAYGNRYVMSVDVYGWTPLHYATAYREELAVAVLLSYDAHLIARTYTPCDSHYYLPSGVTALHIAASHGDMSMISLLLRAYFEGSADLLPSQTALMVTIERTRRQQSHPDPRLILTRSGRLPYHLAARHGHREALEWLDPSIPLMFLLSGSEPQVRGEGNEAVSLAGVSRLAVLAAKALHGVLMADLVMAEREIEEERKRLEVERAEQAAEAELRRKETRDRLSSTLTGRLGAMLSKAVPRRNSSELEHRTSVEGDRLPKVESLERHKGDKRKSRRAKKSKPTPSRSSVFNLIRFNRESDYSAYDRFIGVTFPDNPQEDGGAVAALTRINSVIRPRGQADGNDLASDAAFWGFAALTTAPDGRLMMSTAARPCSDPGSPGNILMGRSSLRAMQQGEERRRSSLRPSRLSEMDNLQKESTDKKALGGPDTRAVLGAAEGVDPCALSRRMEEVGGIPVGSHFLTRSLSHMSETGASHSIPLVASREAGEGATHSKHTTLDVRKGEEVHLPPIRHCSEAPRDSDPAKLSSLPAPIPGAVQDELEATPEASLSGQQLPPIHPEDAHPPSPNSRLASEGTFIDATHRNGLSAVPYQQHEASDPAVLPGVLSPLRISTTEIPDIEPLPGGSSPTATGAAAHLLQSIKNGFKKMTAQVSPILVRRRNRAPRSAPTSRRGSRRAAGSNLTPINAAVPEPGSEIESDADASSDASSVEETVLGTITATVEDPHINEEDEDTCPVCLDESPVLQLIKCNHGLCTGCARDLCTRHNLTPALCPYCRTVIAGFRVRNGSLNNKQI